MKKLNLILIIFSLFIVSSSAQAATSTAKRLSGQVVYSKEKPNELWVVNPKTLQRTIVSNYKETLNLFKTKFVGISELNFNKITSVGSDLKNNIELAKKFIGKIMLRVENHGAAWYVNPVDLQKYDLSDSLNFFKNLSLIATPISPRFINQPFTNQLISIVVMSIPK